MLSLCDHARMRFVVQCEVDQFLTIFELIRAGFGVSIVHDIARSLSHGCRLVELETEGQQECGLHPAGEALCIQGDRGVYGISEGAEKGDPRRASGLPSFSGLCPKHGPYSSVF
jgi:hypothetical protein